ncbi:MAG: cytochrome b6-f complex subunit PetL [Cyanobacteria bacterium J06642_3]
MNSVLIFALIIGLFTAIALGLYFGLRVAKII